MILEKSIQSLVCSKCHRVIIDRESISHTIKAFPQFFDSFFNSTHTIPTGIGFCDISCLGGILLPIFRKEDLEIFSEEISALLDNRYQVQKIKDLPVGLIDLENEKKFIADLIKIYPKILMLYFFLNNQKYEFSASSKEVGL